MKLPNGYGSVSKMKGNHRKPWRVQVTVGWIETDGKKKQKKKTIGYAVNKKDALDMLAQYNQDPHRTKGITFGEVYNRWSKEHYQDLAQSNVGNYTKAFDRSEILHDKLMDEIKPLELEDIMRNEELKPSAKKYLKLLYNQLWDYAMRHEIVTRNTAKIAKKPKEKRKTFEEVKAEAIKREARAFTDEEIAILWSKVDDPRAKTILFGCYTGVRPTELMEGEIHGDEFWTGSKTENGIFRKIPIHPKIRGITDYRRFISEYEYRREFNAFLKPLGINHVPYDTRHTFSSWCDRFGIDLFTTKWFMGHKLDDITKDVYTHKRMEELQKEIEKIGV